jgi:hypothetical protein
MKRAPDDFDLPDINVPSIDLGADVELPSVAGADERDQADIDIEKQAAAELEALRSDFQKRAKNEEKVFYEATDSEHWIAICFQSREQKEEFLAAKKWERHGDKYLDGADVARQEGVKLTPAQPPRKTRPISKKLTDLT